MRRHSVIPSHRGSGSRGAKILVEGFGKDGTQHGRIVCAASQKDSRNFAIQFRVKARPGATTIYKGTARKEIMLRKPRTDARRNLLNVVQVSSLFSTDRPLRLICDNRWQR